MKHMLITILTLQLLAIFLSGIDLVRIIRGNRDAENGWIRVDNEWHHVIRDEYGKIYLDGKKISTP